MKKLILMLTALLSLTAFTACNDYETYGDKKEKERKAIRQFLADSSFVVIKESEFHQRGDVTDVGKREFVYMENSGVYMQIVSRGCGTPIADGETCDLLMRFLELSIIDTAAIYNDTHPYDVDVMNVRRQGNTFTAAFTSGLFASTYQTGAVPAGLLVPLSYLNVGRPRSDTDQIAKVRLIVPHSQGNTVAVDYVYPYYYEITLQRKIDL